MVTNDDGFQSQGIAQLAELMMPLGEVIIVAPEGGRSGTACSVSSTTTVRLTELSPCGDANGAASESNGACSDCRARPTLSEAKVVSCSGTPVDCVKLALERVCPRKPDLVVSGINHGDNASISVHYSGTIGAVIEACMKGIPAIGYSLRTREKHCDFSPYSDVIVRVAKHVLENGLPVDVCLNVNFPEVERLAGVRVARLARGKWSAEWASAHHPRGENHFWLTGYYTNLEPEATDTDYWALDQGYAAITPLKLDMTAHECLAALSGLNQDFPRERCNPQRS